MTYPEIQRRAQVQLDAVVGPDRLPTLNDRSQLPYIDALLKEVMRFTPVTPLGKNNVSLFGTFWADQHVFSTTPPYRYGWRISGVSYCERFCGHWGTSFRSSSHQLGILKMKPYVECLVSRIPHHHVLILERCNIGTCCTTRSIIPNLNCSNLSDSSKLMEPWTRMCLNQKWRSALGEGMRIILFRTLVLTQSTHM